MRRFTVVCTFAGGQKWPFHIYVGEPEPTRHPLQNQAHWLTTEKQGTIPQEVMENFDKLHNIAKENGVSFEELCVYALGTAANGEEQPVAS